MNSILFYLSLSLPLPSGLKSQVDSYNQNDCAVRSYTLIPQFAQYAIVMPKMSPYRDMFNQGIEKLRESGTYTAVWSPCFLN